MGGSRPKESDFDLSSCNLLRSIVLRSLVLFNKLKVLTLFDINKLQTVCFMFKVFNQQLPNYFNDLFIPNSDIHNYNTRQGSDFHISFSRTKSRQLSIVIYWSQKLEQVG